MLNRIRPAIFVLPAAVITMLGQPLTGQQRTARDANVQTLVSRLELGRYKSTIEALSRFGDRRQGTRRNRDAVDWVESQLKSYGCAGVERLTYQYTTPHIPFKLGAAHAGLSMPRRGCDRRRCDRGVPTAA
jgi:hypothetical protein